ncbi:sensor histidine kinase [Dactylosporangium sp. CA-052675]|uniref:sensor histidine kinase n=1 Tax=Dactylosporangium sp. CA-052675 TaxID=3239927 RepID=UPI003D8F0281
MPFSFRRLPRSWYVRLLPIVFAACYLSTADQPGNPVDGWSWACGLTAAALTVVGQRMPTVAVCALALLLVATDRVGTHADVVVLLATMISLVDLALNRRGWRFAAGATSAAAGMFVTFVDVPFGRLPLPFYPIIAAVIGCLVGAPVLLGLRLGAARRTAAEAAERAVESERRRVAETAAARAVERAAIARELHDIVVHHVASIVLRVGVARHLGSGESADTKAVFDDVHATGTAVLEDLRRLVAVLREPTAAGDDPPAPVLDAADLPDALDQAVNRIRQAGLPVTVVADSAMSQLDAVRGLAVLRVVQEGLINVLKHAGPDATAALRVVASPSGEVCVEITDDGGPRKAAPVRGGGHGLMGLRERVTLLGGHLEAGPGPTGWRIRAVLPAGADAGARSAVVA